MIGKNLLTVIFVSIVVLSSSGKAQGPPPVAKKASDPPVKAADWPSVKDVTDTNRFSSIEDKFSIGMPRSISGFQGLGPQEMNVYGDIFTWRLREGFAAVTYRQYLDPAFDLKTDKDYADFFTGLRDGFFKSIGATITAESYGQAEGARFYKYTFQLSNGGTGIGRIYYKDKRSYSLVAASPKDAPASLLLLTMALDSFAIIPQNKLDEEIQKTIEASTPAPLPQEPVAKKERSDAEDENLNGKVKRVTEESENVYNPSGNPTRHLESVVDYNEKGNWIKRVSYDSSPVPYQIEVYGYIDGARVSHSKSIQRASDPPPAMASPRSNPKPRDMRYGFKYATKYVAGKRSEEQLSTNDGETYMRYVYNHKGDLLEKLVYVDRHAVGGEELNQKYLYKLDSKGNEIERTNYAIGRSMSGDRKYTTKYETFDAKGNWIKKTTSEVITVEGKEVSRPLYIAYRTITYF